MKLTNLAKMAMIGAVALGFAMTSNEAKAQCNTTNAVDIDAQVPYTMDICAAIDNVFTVDVTEPDFGTLGVTHETGEYGCAELAAVAAGTVVEDGVCSSYGNLTGLARIVSDDQLGTAGLIQIDAGGAFNSQEIRLQFQVANADMDCGVGNPALIIGELTTDQATPATWANTGDIVADNAAATIGADVTSPTGALDIYIGAQVWTDENEPSTAVYDTGTCEGEFTITMFY